MEGENFPIGLFRCGIPCTVKPAWTEDNPGWRFYGCANYGEPNYSKFMAWFDPPMCARSKKIIPGLLRRINKAESEVKKQKRMVAVMGSIIVFLVVVVVGYLMGKSVGNGRADSLGSIYSLM